MARLFQAIEQSNFKKLDRSTVSVQQARCEARFFGFLATKKRGIIMSNNVLICVSGFKTRDGKSSDYIVKTIKQNDLAWKDLTMERSDWIPGSIPHHWGLF